MEQDWLSLLGHLLVASLAVAITAYVLPGVLVDGAAAALVTAVLLGVVNAFVRPVLVVLTLPLTVVTLGLFMLVINAALVLLVSAVVPGFVVAGLGWALLFSVVLWLVNMVFYSFVRRQAV